MPLQNRVQPTGDVIAHPARGAFMGNRGILHNDKQELTQKRWAHKAWVTCVLEFKNRRRRLMTPHRYTELFFHDEAVAFAAGHRPCGECRRSDFNAFRQAADIKGKISIYDEGLHTARALPRVFQQRRDMVDIASLPDGVFILDDTGRALLVQKDALFPFSPQGYHQPIKRPTSGLVTALTPKPLIDVLHAGYRLQLRLPN